MGVGWPRGLPSGKLSPRARCCPQGQPSLRARGEDLLTSTFLSDFLHWRQIRAVNPESFCLEDSICSRKIPKTAAGNVPSQLPSLPSAPGSISSCVFFEPIPAASSVSEPERAPLTVFSELLGIQNVGFFIFSRRPQHGAGMLVDTKPLSADLQTALQATGKQDPARASGLPPSHSTAGPEPGRGPGSSGTTALSPVPLACSLPGDDPTHRSYTCEGCKESTSSSETERGLTRDSLSSWVQPLATRGWAGHMDGQPSCLQQETYPGPQRRREAQQEARSKGAHQMPHTRAPRGETWYFAGGGWSQGGNFQS